MLREIYHHVWNSLELNIEENPQIQNILKMTTLVGIWCVLIATASSTAQPHLSMEGRPEVHSSCCMFEPGSTIGTIQTDDLSH